MQSPLGLSFWSQKIKYMLLLSYKTYTLSPEGRVMDLTQVTRAFKRQKVVTIVQLSNWLSCSIVTARRRLKAWHAYTSYNHNGRYYTLPEIAQFDDIGLWWHQGAFFSKHGNLKQTLVYLVAHSEQGLSSTELGEILGLAATLFSFALSQSSSDLPGEHDGALDLVRR